MHALPTHAAATTNVVTAGGLAAAALLGAAIGIEPAVLTVLAVAAVAAIVDLRERRIPDELVLLASAVVVVMTVFGSASPTGVALGAVAAAGPLLLIHVVSPAAMGFGDVKLALPLGGALGAVDPVLALVALCVASAVTAAAGLAGGRTALPFAPGLVVGAATAFIVSFLTDWFPS